MSLLLDGSCQPLAVLTSISGTMSIYSETAFKLWTDAELALRLNALPPVAAPCDTCQSSAEDHRLDGFTIQEWASFAKKKSSIATHVCRINGQLKAELTKLGSSNVGFVTKVKDDIEQSAERNADPVFVNDPWLGKSQQISVADLGSASPVGTSAWRKYKPVAKYKSYVLQSPCGDGISFEKPVTKPGDATDANAHVLDHDGEIRVDSVNQDRDPHLAEFHCISSDTIIEHAATRPSPSIIMPGVTVDLVLEDRHYKQTLPHICAYVSDVYRRGARIAECRHCRLLHMLDEMLARMRAEGRLSEGRLQ